MCRPNVNRQFFFYMIPDSNTILESLHSSMRLTLLSLLFAFLGSTGASPSSPPSPLSPSAPVLSEAGSGSGEVGTTVPEVWVAVLVLGAVVVIGTLGCTAKLMRQ